MIWGYEHPDTLLLALLIRAGIKPVRKSCTTLTCIWEVMGSKKNARTSTTLNYRSRGFPQLRQENTCKIYLSN